MNPAVLGTGWKPDPASSLLDLLDLMEITMYDMYPEWGPSRHRLQEAPLGVEDAREGVQTGLDLRDNGGQRPDDN